MSWLCRVRIWILSFFSSRQRARVSLFLRRASATFPGRFIFLPFLWEWWGFLGREGFVGEVGMGVVVVVIFG